ncbi:substrate-binding periplasmic protein [Fretibacter rubidus]|uniref:substrate-binding periplasmic protein n=1 Tax=Fretibacter rubidus TaxID=570162 RepID=UPI00352BABE2
MVAVSHKIGLGAVSLIENSKVATSANLRDNDVRVAVTEGEIGWEYLRDNYPTKYKSVEALVSKSHDITDTMGAVLQKRADVAIADSISCYRFLKEHDPEGLKLHNPFLNEPLGAFDCGFMVPKREKVFAAWLESELLEIRFDESFLESEAKDLRGWSNLVYRQAPEGVKLPKLG